MEKMTGWVVGQQNPVDSPGDLTPVILHTEDGENWLTQPLGKEYDSFLPNDVIMADEDHAFVVGGFGETQEKGLTLFTSNRGKTWEATEGGMPELLTLSCVRLRGSEL